MEDSIFITSISPRHIIDGRIKSAISTWHGDIYSLNCGGEIEKLVDEYKNVKFIKVDKTAKYIYGKDYVFLNDVFSFIEKLNKDVILINSDIDVIDIELLKKMQYEAKMGLVYLHRHDYVNDINQGVIYKQGIDAMIINRQIANLYPYTLLALGCTHWDIYFPYHYSKIGVPIISTERKVIGHNVHRVQYDNNLVNKLAEHYSWLTGIRDTNFAVNFTYNYLKENTIWL